MWGHHFVLGLLAASLTIHTVVHFVFLVAWLVRPKRRRLPRELPRISILKPIAGVDDDLAANLDSFARIDYPCFEILIGIATAEDPAWAEARSFAARHPHLPIRIIATRPHLALNPKVAQLIDLTRQAQGSVLVVSDANVRVPPDYLRSMLADLLRPGVGLVSSAIRGTGDRSLGAALENAQLVGYVLPVVVASDLLANRIITIGKSMMMRKTDLHSVGGWESVGGVLAEDDCLGDRFRRAGFHVHVSLAPVENRNIACPVRSTFDRHTRWMRMRRTIHPAVFAFEPLLSPAVVAAGVVLVEPGAFTLHFLSLSVLVQMLTTIVELVAVGRRVPSPRLVLASALRPFLLLACWMAAWTSRRVCWRGHRFLIGPNTMLLPLPRSGRLARADADS